MLIINVQVCSAALNVFPPGVLKVKKQQVTLIQLIQIVAYLS